MGRPGARRVTMSKIKSAGVAFAVGLLGCAGVEPSMPPAPEPVATDPLAIHAAIRADIDRLKALDVFVVGDLVMNLPASAYSCYGLCKDAATQEAVAKEEARQAPRLAALVQQA